MGYHFRGDDKLSRRVPVNHVIRMDSWFEPNRPDHFIVPRLSRHGGLINPLRQISAAIGGSTLRHNHFSPSLRAYCQRNAGYERPERTPCRVIKKSNLTRNEGEPGALPGHGSTCLLIQ